MIPFPPVHATLLPDGRVMLFATTGIPARAAWFTPGPIGEELPPLVVLQPDNVPVDVDPPLDFTDASGLQWHIEETLFCSGHSLTADGSLFSAGGTLLYSITDPSTQTRVNYIYGMPQATLYSYPLRTWFRQQNMVGTGESGRNMRWYGTVTRLANQLMLVSSGYELASVQVRRPASRPSTIPGRRTAASRSGCPPRSFRRRAGGRVDARRNAARSGTRTTRTRSRSPTVRRSSR